MAGPLLDGDVRPGDRGLQPDRLDGRGPQRPHRDAPGRRPGPHRRRGTIWAASVVRRRCSTSHAVDWPTTPAATLGRVETTQQRPGSGLELHGHVRGARGPRRPPPPTPGSIAAGQVAVRPGPAASYGQFRRHTSPARLDPGLVARSHAAGPAVARRDPRTSLAPGPRRRRHRVPCRARVRWPGDGVDPRRVTPEVYRARSPSARPPARRGAGRQGSAPSRCSLPAAPVQLGRSPQRVAGSGLARCGRAGYLGPRASAGITPRRS